MSKTISLNFISCQLIEKYTSIQPTEKKIVFWSFLYFFMLLASYFILKPLRDEMGIVNGASNMQWLFSGSFITMLVVIPIFGYVTSRYKIGSVLTFSYLFLILNIVLFYFFFKENTLGSIFPVTFFIWLSVFNLFTISLFWSFMVDSFTNDQSKRLFGIISAGGSLGAISGSLISSTLSEKGIGNMFLVALILLSISLIALQMILRLQNKKQDDNRIISRGFKNTLLKKSSILSGIRLVWDSKYLKGLCLFIILYTTISTFLYFEQANIIENTIDNSSKRIQYFSNMDLITNSLAIFGQLFLTNKFIKQFGLSITLCIIPLLLTFGFIILSTNLTLSVVAVLLVLHRVGNYILMRPGREILYTVCNREEKYKAKNFIDTAVYRSGDTVSGWAFALLISLGFGLPLITIIAIPILIIWGYIGYKLGKRHSANSEKLQLKLNAIK
jgi:AAA family ATP:ADP antiporter